MSEGKWGGKGMDGKKSTSRKKHRSEKDLKKFKVIDGRREVQSEAKPEHVEKEKKVTSETASAVRTGNRQMNISFIKAGIGFGLVALVMSFIMQDFREHFVVIGICAGVLVYVALHLVNFVLESRQVALKIGLFVVSALLLAALLYTFIMSVKPG